MTIIYAGFRAAASEQTAHPGPTSGIETDVPPRTLSYFGPADIAYITHDLPEPVIHDILGTTENGDDGHKIEWEDLGLTALMGSYFIFATVMLFRVASFATFFLR
jgi:hypothetical protein